MSKFMDNLLPISMLNLNSAKKKKFIELKFMKFSMAMCMMCEHYYVSWGY